MIQERIKTLRLEAKLTQKQIAEKLGISIAYYSQWEVGKRTPASKNLQKLADIYNVSTDYLLGNTDEKKSTKVEEDLEKSLDTFKSFDGKPMSDHDRNVIRKILRNMFDDEKWLMHNKVKRLINELGIKIKYADIDSNGFFGTKNKKAIIIINDNLSELDTALVLLHETAHFLNQDCKKCITNQFQNNNIEYEANRYMIQAVMKMLDEQYDFTPDTNYQQIIESLNLPYHLDGVVADEFHDIISNKFKIEPYYDPDNFYE